MDCRRAVALLLAAIPLAPIAASEAGRRKEVLVYYANETAPEGQEAANYDTIIGWLKTGDDEKHAEIAAQLERDRRVFAAAIDVETNALMCEIPDLEDGPQAVIFSNRLVREGKCLVWRRGWEGFDETDFPAPQHENYIVAANPLSHSDTMKDVLAFVADQFDPREHEFILVVKSHGKRDKALTPRLAVRAEETGRKELLRVAADRVGTGELPEWAGKLGMSKHDFFSILGQSTLHFSLVDWEACSALTEEVRPERLPDNVARLLLTSQDTHYINHLFADLLCNLNEGDRLSDAMTRNLPSKFVILSKNGSALARPSSIPSWTYFVPLGLFILWVLWQWRGWGRTKAEKAEQGGRS